MKLLSLTYLLLSAYSSGIFYAPQHREKLSPDNVVAILKAMTGAKVTVSGPKDAKYTIIHLADYHFVPFDQFAADLKDQGATDAETRDAYQKHLRQVEAHQLHQMAILRGLIRCHGLRNVLVEGITRETSAFVDVRIMLAREMEKSIPAVHARKAEATPGSELHRKITALLAEHRRNMLAIGAAGRLVVSGELSAVLPLDDAKALEDANPLKNGKFKLDSKANAKRERTIIANAMKRGPVSVIILGRGHRLERHGVKVMRVE